MIASQTAPVSAKSKVAPKLEALAALMEQHDGQYSDTQLEVFDQAFAALTQGIEDVALAGISLTFSGRKQAPPGLVDRLLVADDITVAGPILKDYGSVPESRLINVAQKRGDPHLQEIAQRHGIGPNVTDVLVERGSEAVLAWVVENKTARFSEDGVKRLADRVAALDELAEKLARRDDLPKHVFFALVGAASAQVQENLRIDNVHHSSRIDAVVHAVTDRIATKTSKVNWDFDKATQHLLKSKNRQIDESTVDEQVRNADYAATVAAIAIAGSLSPHVVHDILQEPTHDDTVILAKALALRWQTTRDLLALKTSVHNISGDYTQALASHTHTAQSKAQKLLRRRAQAQQMIVARPRGGAVTGPSVVLTESDN